MIPAEGGSRDYTHLPELLQWNMDILSEEDKLFVNRIASLGQQHLFASWDAPGVNNDLKLQLLAQLRALDQMAGGLEGYITRAKGLLKASRDLQNPFEGWTATIPTGIALEPFTPEYNRLEQIGLQYIHSVGFVLVAGGLGERLGYGGIKVELPVQTVTSVCYLAHYCSQILAMQIRYGTGQIPLAIMVSEDTHAKTMALLQGNGYFGLDPDQVTILLQAMVPALNSNQAQFAMSSAYAIECKPHGHGDVHTLMHTSGTAARWLANGIKHVVFFQDTNGLAFHTLPAVLGVSVEQGLVVNTVTIQRIAAQAMGAIVKLIKGNQEMTINVEYNQLDALLPAGDVNVNGHSPYPGNTNQLVFEMETYCSVLRSTQGIMPEFVNPKYADSSRMLFKKPTRLECMMQDFPKLLPEGAKVGFTCLPGWLCYSPCKNNFADAAAALANGIPAACPFTSEADQYAVYVKLLRLLCVDIEEKNALTVLGVSATMGPLLVIHPSCAIFPCELAARFPHPEQVKITARSTLLLEGDVTVHRLCLDGALQVQAAAGSTVCVHLPSDTWLTNTGHVLQILSPDELTAADEVVRMRGYQLSCREMKSCLSSQQGAWVFNGAALVGALAFRADEEEEELEELGCAEDGQGKGRNPDSCLSWVAGWGWW